MNSQSIEERNRRVGLGMAILCGLCWAVLAILLKVALGFAASGTIAWFRLGFSFVFLAAFLGLRNPQNLRILKVFPLMGVLAATGLAINYFGFMKGVELTSPSNAQVFIQIAPLTLILAGIVFFKERPSRIQILGFVLTALGFGIFFKDQLDHAIQEIERFTLGNLWIVLAAFSWTAFAIFQKLLLKTWTPQHVNLLLFAVAGVLLAPLVQWSDFATMTPWQWVWMAGLGLNTVIAYGALGVALQKAPASQVSVIITLNPLLTLALMTALAAFEVTWIVPDRIEILSWIGAMIVVIGVILAVRQKREVSRPLSE